MIFRGPASEAICICILIILLNCSVDLLEDRLAFLENVLCSGESLLGTRPRLIIQLKGLAELIEDAASEGDVAGKTFSTLTVR